MREYRKAVISIFYFRCKILLVEKYGVGWQFPQGGIEEGEDEETALRRELHEELGIDQSKIKAVKKSGQMRKYEWPKKMQLETGMKGQMQTAFFVFLSNSEISLNDAQLKSYSWISQDSAIKMLGFSDLKSFAKRMFQELNELI